MPPIIESPAMRYAAPAILLALAACHAGGHDDATLPGDRSDDHPYAGISATEVLRLAGNEPFWGGDIDGDRLTYRTVEQPEGQELTVQRFAGRGGLSYSGLLNGKDLTVAVTPGTCTDGMADRTYPFVATLQWDDKTVSGCAWTDKHPYEEAGKP